MLRDLRYRVEAVIARLWLTLFGAMSLDRASNVGGWLGRTVGPLTRVHVIAARNLARAMPELSAQERKKILRDMWDNLGRVIGEFPHLPSKALSERVRVTGWSENVKPLLDKGIGVVFIGGHIGNWEMAPKVGFDKGASLTLIYRHANNPYADKMIHEMRSPYYTDMFHKTAASAFKMIRALKNGKSIGILVDQKMNDGMPIPFFGHEAMTSMSPAQLSLTFDAPLIPGRVIRTGTEGAHFDVILYPAMQFQKTGDIEADIKAAMTKINALLESWIREYPAQWFWVHNRWPKEK